MLGRGNLQVPFTSPDFVADSIEPARSSKIVKNLQVLRLIAACMVLVDHMQYEVFSRPAFQSEHFQPSRFLFWAGGVDIFFIISGFIIYTVGRDYFGSRHGSSKFLLRRIVRVVPSYWVFTTLMILSMIVLKDNVNHSDFRLADILASYAFFPHLNAYGTFYPVLSLGWTLNFEAFFYVLFALALALGRRWGMVCLVMALVVFGFLGMSGVVNVSPFAFWCDSIILEFAMGMMLAYFYHLGVSIPKPVAVVVCLLSVLAISLAMAFRLDETKLQFRVLWMGIPALAICAALVLIEANKPAGPVMRALIFGGNISFAIYLSHPFTMNATAIMFNKFGLHSPTAFFIVGSLVIFAGAAAVYLFFEKPVTGVLGRLVNRLWPEDRGGRPGPARRAS